MSKQKTINKPSSEDLLQAVVLADSFDHKFSPLTLDLPRCLLPICNIPLIEYTFELLVLNEVKEIFLIACHKSDLIKEYISNSKWGKPNSSVKVSVIVTQHLLSVGDALREVDSKSIIRSDFILMSADVVSNMKLQDAIDSHKQRRLKNKELIMTMVVKESTQQHPTRYPEIDATYVLDSNSNECLYYEMVDSYPIKTELNIPLDKLLNSNNNEFEIRKDLVDCFVDICSEEVLALFTENFDYQDLRRDFVHGILTSDILGKSIHCHILNQSGYAAKVSNPKMYDSISKDILGRWVYPFVPDTNLIEGTSYSYTRQQVYKENNVQLSRSCKLDKRVCIGNNTIIGNRSIIKNSVIGRNCIIGNNVILNSVYLFDNCTIKDNCNLNQTIIGNDVIINNNTNLLKGNLIKSFSELGPNCDLPNFIKIINKLSSPQTSDDDDDNNNNNNNNDIKKDIDNNNKYGIKAYIYEDEFSEDEDEDEDNLDNKDFKYNFQLTQLGYALNDLPELPQLQDTLTDIDENDGNLSDDNIDDEERKELEFEKEAKSTIERALNEGLTLDNASLELTALRMSYNAEFIQLRECIIPQLINHIDCNKPLIKAIQSVLKKWSPLISKFTISDYDMVDAIDILMLACADHSTKFKPKLFTLSLKLWYDMDIISEDAILDWYDEEEPDRLADRLDDYHLLRNSAKPFIDWLQEAEEDSN